jgi:beta-lactamase superfamily II metal-dependent hydrolase
MAAEDLIVDFWDVGQGDCSVIRLSDNNLIVIDVADAHSPLISWLSENPQLQIAHLILTHNDADHAGALPSLLSACKGRVHKLWLLKDRMPIGPERKKMDRLFRSAYQAYKEGWLAVQSLEAPLVIWQDPQLNLKLEVLYPVLLEHILDSDCPNTSSAILALSRDGEIIVGWPGDNYLQRARDAYAGSRVELLHGPHHGAPVDRKQNPQFKQALSEIAPARVFVSVGSKNIHNHPNQKYVRRLQLNGCRVACSQVTRFCDKDMKNRDSHVLDGASLLGLRRPRNGFACRGAMRLMISKTNATFDEWDGEHLGRVSELYRPMCLSRALHPRWRNRNETTLNS